MRAVIALPFTWLIVFFLLPFGLVLVIAFGTNAPDSAPPVELGVNFESFRLLFTDDLYLAAWISSLRIAATSTLGALAGGTGAPACALGQVFCSNCASTVAVMNRLRAPYTCASPRRDCCVM